MNEIAILQCEVESWSMSKSEFPALLSPGVHQFQVTDLEAAFVARFPESVRRPILLAGLLKFVNDIRTLTIAGELWFDGSFATEKQEPNDVDLVVIFDPASVSNLTIEQQQRIEYLFHRPTARATYNCDVYCAHSSDVVAVSYWRGWFGFKRDGKTAKGIGYITL